MDSQGFESLLSRQTRNGFGDGKRWMSWNLHHQPLPVLAQAADISNNIGYTDKDDETPRRLSELAPASETRRDTAGGAGHGCFLESSRLDKSGPIAAPPRAARESCRGADQVGAPPQRSPTVPQNSIADHRRAFSKGQLQPFPFPKVSCPKPPIY